MSVTILAVFDPSAGFTTGGGTLIHNSVNANFGFNVQAKSSKIKGQLEYLDHTTGDNWHSLSMTSLMVSI